MKTTFGASLLALSLFAGPCLGSATPDEQYEAGYQAFLSDDLITAMDQLSAAAERGHVKSMVLLAYIFDKAEENETAVALYGKAVDRGDPTAKMRLAQHYISGEGVEKDEARALALITSAAEDGHVPAVEQMVIIHGEGLLGVAVDPAATERWSARLAELQAGEGKE